MQKGKFFIFFLCLSLWNFSQAQQWHTKNLNYLDDLLKNEKYTEAQTFVKKKSSSLQSTKSYSLLADYIYYTGKIESKLKNQTFATQATKQFVKNILSTTDSLKVHRQVQVNLAMYYEYIGDSKNAFECNNEALKITKKWKQATPEDFGLIESNLAVLANRNGKIAEGIKHSKKALTYYESYTKTNKKNLYSIYNTLGGSMWYESKIDSALYFYKKATKTLEVMESNPINNYYRPATVYNNIAAIYGAQGNFEEALATMEKTINYINSFLKSDAADNKKEGAKELLFMAIENYAGFYKELGDYAKAKELLEYSFKEKQKHFKPDNPELYKAKILLGQIYLALKDYQSAETFLDDGIAQIKILNDDLNYWNADAHYSKATLNDELGKTAAAKIYYDKAEQLYEEILEGSYDELYLDFIRNASHFYAQNNEKAKALKMAQKAYAFIKENKGATTSFVIQQGLSLGEIYFELGDYPAALAKGNTIASLLNTSSKPLKSIVDSTKIILYKPQTILLTAQASHKIQKNSDDILFLKKTFIEIKEAIALLEKQKTFISDDVNVSILIENNTKLFYFAKQLALNLYEKTKNQTYLNEAVSLHESILYNRIRSRLNSRTSITYANVPKNILAQETAIKKKLQATLQQSDNIDAYLKATTEWNVYLKNLKKKYPKYYKLRFESIAKSIKGIEKKIPKNTSIIRYLYAEKELFVVLVSKNKTQLFKLNPKNIAYNISQLQNENSLFKNNFKAMHELYISLWKPFEKELTTNRVVIIPDQDLFNLNFEMLTTKVISNYKEMTTSSLLSKHIVSYNYSLFLIDKGSQTVSYKDNFVAFVPEFNDKMKSDYQISIKDSMELDKTYLKLLSQPFTKDLAQQSARLFSGISFLNEKSTEQLFKNSAKEHKIIHIGTHAESNNVSPELSRLVFAKATNSTAADDNYLYTYEIYNTNLSSNLAILTACETGKPTYQPGEGMISLAHAFNYAGSESILTSLWKIDEQSSAVLIASFYKYLKKGWAKDKALQQAKLDYLATAEGRTIHPQYWAGLVLIGDVAPIEMSSSSNIFYWILGVMVLIIVFFISRKKKENKMMTSL